MKSMIKTLLVSALTVACASAVYAQGAGGGGGGAAGYSSGTAPGGDNVNQAPTNTKQRNTGGYGSPGSPKSSMGNGSKTTTPGNSNPSNSNSTGNDQQRQ
jgi:hypothetical protein